MPGFAEVLFEGRQSRLSGGELGLKADYIGVRDRSGFVLGFGEAELFFLKLDDLLRGRDFGPVRRLGHGGVDHIA